MGRKRLAKNRGLPPNLYQNSAGYYYYLDPDRRNEKGKPIIKGMGKDKVLAFNSARDANAALAVRKPSSLVDWVLGRKEYTLREWLPEYEKLWLAKAETPPPMNTMRSWKSMRKKIESSNYCWRRLKEVETAHIAQHLEQIASTSGATTAVVFRSRISDVFRMAETQGHIPSGTNPVTATYVPRKAVMRERLSLEQFLKIREAAAPPLRRAMNLALVTAQRREDIVNMQFSDFKDGKLYVAQGKTGMRLGLSGAIRLEAIGISIEQAVMECRDLVISKYLIHHVRTIARVKAGQQVDGNGLSNSFQQAREAAGIVAAEGRTPPSFHEIRSLAERLYKAERGAEFAQAILGHKNARMTAVYDDLRGQGWVSVS